jgi:hypothetical protein
MGYFRFCVKRWGKTKKNKLKGTQILFWGDKSIILRGKNYFFGIFKVVFKKFKGTFVPPTQHVGPPLYVTVICHHYIIYTFFFVFILWKMLDLQHQYNNCITTPHMRVNLIHRSPPSCERLLCSCYDGVVQESNPLFFLPRAFHR